MTYILSDKELNALVGFYGILPESISPYKINPEARTPEVLGSLQKAGLTESSGKDFFLSEDGRVLAELLASPGICVSFTKKTDRTSATVFVNDPTDPSLWCVCLRTSEPEVNIIKIFLSKDSAVAFLRKEVFPSKAEFNEDFDVDISLTYEEWMIFGLSQMCYMRRQSAGEVFLEEEKEYLSDGDIFNERFFGFLADASATDKTPFSTPEKRETIYESLCAKGVFEKKPEGGLYKYSDSAKIWLDNDVAYDSVNVFYSNTEGVSYALVLTLRVNGVTSMRDTGEGVRIVSSKSVPFSAYLS